MITTDRSQHVRGPKVQARYLVGVGLTAVPLAVALLGPLIAEPGSRGPAFVQGEKWLLGTDSEGRDVLTQLLLGGRPLVLVATAAVLLTYLLAVPWGGWLPRPRGAGWSTRR